MRTFKNTYGDHQIRGTDTLELIAAESAAEVHSWLTIDSAGCAAADATSLTCQRNYNP